MKTHCWSLSGEFIHLGWKVKGHKGLTRYLCTFFHRVANSPRPSFPFPLSCWGVEELFNILFCLLSVMSHWTKVQCYITAALSSAIFTLGASLKTETHLQIFWSFTSNEILVILLICFWLCLHKHHRRRAQWCLAVRLPVVIICVFL